MAQTIALMFNSMKDERKRERKREVKEAKEAKKAKSLDQKHELKVLRLLMGNKA